MKAHSDSHLHTDPDSNRSKLLFNDFQQLAPAANGSLVCGAEIVTGKGLVLSYEHRRLQLKGQLNQQITVW